MENNEVRDLIKFWKANVVMGIAIRSPEELSRTILILGRPFAQSFEFLSPYPGNRQSGQQVFAAMNSAATQGICAILSMDYALATHRVICLKRSLREEVVGYSICLPFPKEVHEIAPHWEGDKVSLSFCTRDGLPFSSYTNGKAQMMYSAPTAHIVKMSFEPDSGAYSYTVSWYCCYPERQPGTLRQLSAGIAWQPKIDKDPDRETLGRHKVISYIDDQDLIKATAIKPKLLVKMQDLAEEFADAGSARDGSQEGQDYLVPGLQPSPLVRGCLL